jgi:hypothetical protein
MKLKANIIQPDAVPIADERYRLRSDWEQKIEIEDVKLLWRIPKGFVWDGMSVPRFAWSLVGLTPDGIGRAACLLHDWLYEWAGKIPHDSCVLMISEHCYAHYAHEWTRKEADEMLREMLRASGEDRVHIGLCFSIVRTFGKGYWGKPLKEK